jgi:hypothetical protein
MALMTFDEYRSRISIADMAEFLGYWRNPHSGVAKPSYCLGDKKKPEEEIVIFNIDNPAKQTYFNRYGTDKGNLINFIEARLDKFSKFTTEKGFKGVNDVLGGYLNNPSIITQPKQSTTSQIKKTFNLHYWNLRPLPSKNSYLIGKRKLSEKTVDDFRSGGHIYLAGNKDNVAFPYRTWPRMEIDNLEMRNYSAETNVNYKGFPAGGNKTSSVWLATFAPDNQITDLYIFESAIDAMSFYELKHFTKETTSGFVSTGGYMTKNQIEPLMKRFPSVRWHSCMDNDATGNVYDVSLAYYLKGQECKGYANRIGEEKIITLSQNGKTETFNEESFSSSEYLKKNNIDGMEVTKPGRGKDWNELLVYYKRFDLNLSPTAKISLAINETLSQLNLRGYCDLTTVIDRDCNIIVNNIFSQIPNAKISSCIAQTNAYSMFIECELKMLFSEFIVEPTALHIIDNVTQKQISAQPLLEYLKREKINLLKDFHSDDLKNFLEKNNLSFKGRVDKSFERTISPSSGWGLKEISPIKKNSLDLDNSL